MIRFKVCGMRDPQNISDVLKLDIHFMGFIFYEPSPRHIHEAAQAALLEAMPNLPFSAMATNVKKVGVFVNASIDYVVRKVNTFGLDYVQLHGRESVFFCSQLRQKGIKIIKAFSIDERFRFTNTDFYQFDCDYFLFDTKGKKAGGNGVPFNWDLLQKYKGDTPFFLSGGIGIEEVNALHQFNHPQLYGIDINSKFETAPAQKDTNAISIFLQRFYKYKT